MTMPKDIKSLNDLSITPSQPIFHTRIFLFGILPIDYSDLTLLEIKINEGFAEESPMGSMKLWRHERKILPTAIGSKIIDHLTFQPKWGNSIVAWFIRKLFEHRHNVLKRYLNPKV